MKLQLIFGRVLLLYQMPKAGSQSLEATLGNCGLPHLILRLHYLSAENARALKRGLQARCATAKWKRDATGQLRFISRISGALKLRRWLRLCGLNIPPVEIISGVREVIGAALSSIFENYAYFAPRLELMTADLCREVLLHPRTCGPLHDWFDVELKRHTGLDVFAQPFRVDVGHALFENQFARALVYRFDRLPQLAPVLGDFLGCRPGRLMSRNVGRAKSYARQYLEVKQNLRLPEEFVTRQLNSKLMRHFYSLPARAAFKRKWANQPPAQLEILESSFAHQADCHESKPALRSL